MATEEITATCTQTTTSRGETTAVDPKLNKWDRMVLENIAGNINETRDRSDLGALGAPNDPKHDLDDFEPAVFASIDLDAWPEFLKRYLAASPVQRAR